MLDYVFVKRILFINAEVVEHLSIQKNKSDHTTNNYEPKASIPWLSVALQLNRSAV